METNEENEGPLFNLSEKLVGLRCFEGEPVLWSEGGFSGAAVAKALDGVGILE